MSPAPSMSTSNSNNNDSSGSPLLRSPRRVKRDSASLKHSNNSCGDLMEDMRKQLSMPMAPLLPDQEEQHSQCTVLLSVLDDDEDDEDGDLDDSSEGGQSNSTDCSSASRLAARKLLLQNTQANSVRQNHTRTKNAQANPQQQPQHRKIVNISSATTSRRTNPRSSDASVVSNQSIKSSRSLFSRLSRKSANNNPYQREECDDRTTATVSSTKSWWKKRKEQTKKINPADSDKKKKKPTIFQSFRLKRKRNKGRHLQQQLVADFFDVQSVASVPDFVGSSMVQQARWGTSNRHCHPLETRSVTSQTSRSHAFASFLLRLRQKDTDMGEYNDYGDNASQGNNLIGNQIEAHENDSEYDDEITLGSGFENISLADSLDDSSVCSETTFHANMEAAVAEAASAQQQQNNQQNSEQRPSSSLVQPELKPQSFLQRMLSKSSSPNDDIIRKIIGAAASQPPPEQPFASTMPDEADKDSKNVPLNSTISETDSDDNPVNDEHFDHQGDWDNKGDNDQNQDSSASAMVAPVRHGRSLMQGNMVAKARSERCLELVPIVADVHVYHPEFVSSQGSDSIKCSDTEDDDEDENYDATVTKAQSAIGVANRWDSDASVASDTPLPKRPQRRTTGQFSGSDTDDSDSESAQGKSLQQPSQPQQQAHDERKRQEYEIHSASAKSTAHNNFRQQTKTLASKSMRNLKTSDEEVDDESILSLLAGLLATWASEREAAAAEEAIIVVEDLDNHVVEASNNNGGLKSVLKNSAASALSPTTYMESKEEEENDGGLRLSVTFDYVEIREYERVVGDNPSCTRGPPVAIGWIYQTGTMCPVDDYESLIRGPRRSKREFHLSPEQRTQILVEEWKCSEEDIRRARREATYIQYCRAKTSFSGSRVAAKEAAFLRKANERTKMQVNHQQQQQREAAFMMPGTMPMGVAAPPTTIPYSPTNTRRMHSRTASPTSPSSRDNRPKVRKTGRSAPPPIHSSPIQERRAPQVISSPSKDRRNGSGNSTGQYAYPKAHPVSPTNRPKTPPLSKCHTPPASLSSSSSSSTSPAPSQVPPTRTLLEV